jgi:hypothetical protein
MATSGCLGTQAIIAFDIGFGFEAQDQGLRCVDIWAGPVPVLFRSGAHVKRLFVRRPRGFSSPMLNADGAGCKSR